MNTDEWKRGNMIKKFFKNKDNLITIATIAFLPMLIELIVEIFSRSSVIDGFVYMFTHPMQFLCNAFIIMCSISLMLLVKRRVFYCSIISVIWIVLGIVNMVLLYCRVTPFNASDLRLIDTGIKTAGKYFNFVTFVLAIAAAAGVIAAIVAVFIKAPKIKYKIVYWKNLIVIGVIFVFTAAFVNISIDTGFLSRRFSNLTDSYLEYGFVYCFGNSLVNTGVKKPSDYSEEKIDEIIEKDNKEEIKEDKKEEIIEANVLFLQLESFIDLSNVKGLELSQDPIPTFNRLKKKYTSGNLEVYNIGYGTSNTEFEIMTGLNLDDFGPGEFPYRTILLETTCESIGYDLKENGYATHAIHNNNATFYSRNTVFENLGFDTFTSLEYMNDVEYTPIGWAKDNCLVDQIFNAMDSTEEKDFVYTISVQGHGSYPSTSTYENPEILVSGVDDEARKYAIEYYANEIHEMDNFIAELTKRLSKYDEKVVLVMYGDHLPGLGFSEDDLHNGSLYKTEYIIWDNFGLKKSDEDVQTFQLASKVLEQLNISTGVINNFHQNNKNDIEYLARLQNLTYDILYGDLVAYEGINPYEPTEIQMGVLPISISYVDALEDNVISVKGKNFTPYSVVYVNQDRYETEFVSENELKITYEGLENLDSFVVAQVDSDDVILSETKECLYYGNNQE